MALGLCLLLAQWAIGWPLHLIWWPGSRFFTALKGEYEGVILYHHSLMNVGVLLQVENTFMDIPRLPKKPLIADVWNWAVFTHQGQYWKEANCNSDSTPGKRNLTSAFHSLKQTPLPRTAQISGSLSTCIPGKTWKWWCHCVLTVLTALGTWEAEEGGLAVSSRSTSGTWVQGPGYKSLVFKTNKPKLKKQSH